MAAVDKTMTAIWWNRRVPRGLFGARLRNMQPYTSKIQLTTNVQAIATKSLTNMMANTVHAQSEPPDVMCLSAVGGFWSSDPPNGPGMTEVAAG